MPSTAVRYENLKEEDEGEEEYAPFIERKPGTRSTRPWIVLMILFSGSLVFLIVAFFWIQTGSTSSWSTAGFDRFSRHDVKFSGSVKSESPYRGPPSPEVDAAWERFTTSPWIDGTAVVLGVGQDEVARARKDTDEEWYNSTVQLSDENGGGTMATLEMFHQLHCLDLIRRYTHYDYYKASLSQVDTNPELQRNHIDHCIEIIRQVIMCNGGTELITFHWVKDIPNPYPDFNTWHTCRDPEEVLALAKKREAPIKHRVLKTEGIVEMSTPP